MYRISKKKAEAVFDNGGEICVLPSKLNPASEWGKSYVSWQTKPEGVIGAFEKLCNAVLYYNCNDELGNGLAFYSKEAA